jgi:hypothetical protein
MAPTLSGHPPPESPWSMAELRVSSSKPLLRSVTVALDVRSATFWNWLVLGVKPVLSVFTMTICRRRRERLALPGQGLRLPRGFIAIKNGALRQALISPVIEPARNEGLCSAAVQSTALQMRIRRKRVL